MTHVTTQGDSSVQAVQEKRRIGASDAEEKQRSERGDRLPCPDPQPLDGRREALRLDPGNQAGRAVSPRSRSEAEEETRPTPPAFPPASEWILARARDWRHPTALEAPARPPPLAR